MSERRSGWEKCGLDLHQYLTRSEMVEKVRSCEYSFCDSV